MSSIDERVVRMKMDDSQFTSGASRVSSSLDKLKSKLDFRGASKGLSNIDAATKSVNFNGITSGIESLNNKFSAMGVVAATIFSKITSAAIAAGHNVLNTLTQGVRGGFEEYETQMGAVQTILANTASKGSTLEQVNSALNTLNTYADKTIYNFTEMTKNIGTFTAAGVDLQTSVNSIQGIANLAAMSGSTSQQASTAMYQLSQAIAAGTVRLMDWNSVVNAGMGGEAFQNALIRTSEHLKTGAKAAIKAKGSFRESLASGWLTSKVLTETLAQFALSVDTAEDYNNAMKDLVGQGYTQKEAKAIVDMAKSAGDAATKVKTFSQLIDTLKEAIGSGWTQSWQTMIGDFDESKELWTGVNDVLSNMVQTSANARNQLLSSGLSSGWKQLLDQGIEDSGRFKDTLKQVARDHGVAVDDMVNKEGSLEKTFHNGWVTGDMLKESISRMTDKMSKMSKEQLKSAGYTTDQVRKMQALNKKVQEGSINVDDYAKKMSRMSGRENVIKGIETAFNSLQKVLGTVKSAFREVFPPMTGEQLYDLTVKFKNFTETLKPSKQTLDDLHRTFKGLFSAMDLVKQGITGVAKVFGSFFRNTGGFGTGLLHMTASFGDLITKLDQSSNKTKMIQDAFDRIAASVARATNRAATAFKSFSNLGDALSRIGTVVGRKVSIAFDKVKDVLSSITNWISKNITGKDVFAGLAGGGLFLLGAKLAGLIGKIKKVIGDLFDKLSSWSDKSSDITDQFADTLGVLQKSLSAFTGSIRAVTLLEIAAALTILVSAIERISKMDPINITKGIGTLAVLMVELNFAMRSFAKTVSKFDSKGIIQTGLATIAFAKALDILASAMGKFDDLDFGDIAKGLGSLGTLMLELSLSMKMLNKTVSIRTSLGLLAMAGAINLLMDPLRELSSLSWERLGKGMAGLAGSMLTLSATMKILGLGKRSGLAGSVGMIILTEALVRLVKPLKSLGNMDWESIGRGLSAMGGALLEMSLSLGVLGKLASYTSLFAAGSIWILVQGLAKMSKSLISLSHMNWEQIARGLTAMGGALLEISLLTGALGKIGKMSSLLGAASIWVVIQGLDKLQKAFRGFGSMDWEPIGRAATAMGGALLEVSLVSGALGKLTKLSGILGASAIWITVQSLDKLYSAFSKFARMDWEPIGRGLTAMGGALLEISVITGALGAFSGLKSVLGSIDIMVAIKPLNPLSDSLKRFASMDWDSIGRGLSAMGGALGEVALVTSALGWVGNLAALVGAGTLLLAVQGLDQLATAVIRFSMLDWKAADNGIKIMGQAMGETGLGSLLNTFSGLGSLSISAVAKPLGDLADSVRKWEGVKLPPNLSDQLAQLAGGVMKFTFGNLGAWALSDAAPALNVLATAVRNWQGVTVPKGIEGELASLSNGVKSFTWAFMGGWSLSAAAGPLGDMSMAVRKWQGVTVPDGIETGLYRLSNGVKSFTWAFMAGWSIGTVAGPLGDLSMAVRKWTGVVIPDDIEVGLYRLSNGVKSFSWAFLGGWSLTAITGPLGDLSGAVRRWMGVVVPDDIESGLQQLSSGVRSFSWAFLGGWSLSAITEPLGDLASSVRMWMGVVIPDGLGGGLSSLSNGVKAFSGSEEAALAIKLLSPALINLAVAVIAASSADYIGLGARVEVLVNTLNSLGHINSPVPQEITIFTGNLNSAVSNAASSMSRGSGLLTLGFTMLRNALSTSIRGMSSITIAELMQVAAGVNAGGSAIMAALMRIVFQITSYAGLFAAAFLGIANATRSGLHAVTTVIASFQPWFKSAGLALGNAVRDGLRQGSSNLTGAVTSGMGAAVNAISSYYGAFLFAGRFAASGIADGMRQNQGAAYAAGTALGNAALSAARRALDEHSPSKEMHKIGEFGALGFGNGLTDTASYAKKAGTSIAQTSLDAMADAMKSASDSDYIPSKYNPVITPVLDLSSLQSDSQKLMSTIPSKLPIETDWSQASNLGSSRSSQNGKNSETTPIVQQVTKNYNFTQTINSPKTPSRTDLYRDGENLLRKARLVEDA